MNYLVSTWSRGVTDAYMVKFCVPLKCNAIFKFAICVLVGIMNFINCSLFLTSFCWIHYSGYQAWNLSESTLFAVWSMSIKCEYQTTFYDKQQESKWTDVFAFCISYSRVQGEHLTKICDETTQILRYIYGHLHKWIRSGYQTVGSMFSETPN